MKFTLSWLKDHLETSASLPQLTEKLSSMGLEVESIDDPAAKLAPFTIARVLEAKRHPNADKLQVCKVDTGSGVVEVVCGAPNAKTGMIGVFAPTGSYIPGTKITLETKPVRGVVSNGMLVSERELELSDDHEGIIELPPSSASKLGERYADVMGLADPVHRGEAHPQPARLHGRARHRPRPRRRRPRQARSPRRRSAGVEGDYDCPVDIKLDFPKEARDACPCFAGRYIRGVTNGASPAWMQQRLKAVGLRPINALVDVTNYISLDRGRPLHVYDADKLKGAIRARLGRKGETFAGLDGKTHAVDDDHVRDRRRPRRAGLRRHPRRRGHRLHRGDQERADRVRLLRSRCAPPPPAARPASSERCALSLRARRRPGLHPAGPRSRHRHDAGGGGRHAVASARLPARRPEAKTVIAFPLALRREARRARARREADPRHRSRRSASPSTARARP